MRLTRRSVLRSTAAALAAPALGALGRGSDPACGGADAAMEARAVAVRRVKYPAGFKHFDYVNPAAPQGGTVRQIAFGTFDNFNHGGVGREGQPRRWAPSCSPKR